MTAEILNALNTEEETILDELGEELGVRTDELQERITELEKSGMVQKKGDGYILTEHGARHRTEK